MGAFLLFLAEHADLIGTLYQAITSGKLTKDAATKALEQAMIAASDAEMRREFPTP